LESALRIVSTHKPISRTPIAIAIAWFVLSGCSDEPLEQPPASIDPAAVDLASEVDTLTPELSIGGETGREEEAFGRVEDLAVGADGSIYVLDGLAHAIRVFRSDGEFVRSIGREGEGPGEFRHPLQLTLAMDGSLWVYDRSFPYGSVLVLAPEGNEIDRFETAAAGPAGGPLDSRWNGVVLADGTLVHSVQHSEQLSEMGLLELANLTFVRTLDLSSGRADSTLLAEDVLRRYRVRAEGPGGAMGTLMGIVGFDPRRLVAIGPDGTVWTALSTEYSISRTGPDGGATVFRVNIGDTSPGDAERTAWDQLRGMDLVLDPPTSRHLVWRMFVDDSHRLWVQRADGLSVSGRFDVFSSEGEPLGSVFLPGEIGHRSSTVRGDYLYAVVSGGLGVPSVVRAPIPNF
jgi:hypothetical protein